MPMLQPKDSQAEVPVTHHQGLQQQSEQEGKQEPG